MSCLEPRQASSENPNVNEIQRCSNSILHMRMKMVHGDWLISAPRIRKSLGVIHRAALRIASASIGVMLQLDFLGCYTNVGHSKFGHRTFLKIHTL